MIICTPTRSSLCILNFMLPYADRDSLRGWKVRGSIPGEGARFSPPVQTGPRAHPASCTMGAGSFPGLKRLRRGVDHPPLSSTEVKGRVELYLFSPSEPLWPVLGWTLTLPLLFYLCRRNFAKVAPSTVKVERACSIPCCERLRDFFIIQNILRNHEDGSANLVRNVCNNLQISTAL